MAFTGKETLGMAMDKETLGFWSGIAFLGGALIFLYMAIQSLKQFRTELTKEEIEHLKTTGQQVITKFKAIDRRWNIKINGQSPLVIYSQDTTGRVFESEDLWFEGSDDFRYSDPRFQAWQQLQAIDTSRNYLIPVYINPSKPTKYYMDLADLRVCH